MTSDDVPDDATTDPDLEDDDEPDPGDAGTPAEHDDEDPHSPPLNIDELPAY